MGAYGYIWIHKDTCGNTWIHMDTYGCIWIHMDTYEYILRIHTGAQEPGPGPKLAAGLHGPGSLGPCRQFLGQGMAAGSPYVSILCSHMCPCVPYVSIYIYIYISRCIHMYPYVSLCIHMYQYVSICIPMYPYVSKCIHMHPYAYICMDDCKSVSR